MGEIARKLHRRLAAKAHTLPTVEPKLKPGELLPGGIKPLDMLIKEGHDPFHAVYVFMQNMTAHFAETISGLPEMEPWAKAVTACHVCEPGAACKPDFYLFDAERKLVYRGQMDASRPGNNQPVTGKDLREAIDAVLAGPWRRTSGLASAATSSGGRATNRSIPVDFAGFIDRFGIDITGLPHADQRGRAAVEVALAKIKAHLAAGRVLAVRLHAFGQRSKTQVVDDADERDQDLLPLRPGTVDAANQRHVELHAVRRHVGQIGQAHSPTPKSL